MQRENGHPECSMKVFQISCHLTIHVFFVPFFGIPGCRLSFLILKLNTIFLPGRERQAVT